LIDGASAGWDFASINRDLHLGLCGRRWGTDSAQLNEPRAGFRTELSGWTESLFPLKLSKSSPGWDGKDAVLGDAERRDSIQRLLQPSDFRISSTLSRRRQNATQYSRLDILLLLQQAIEATFVFEFLFQLPHKRIEFRLRQHWRTPRLNILEDIHL
jgi:hypothetical protein